jgi:choline dehydrogenase-like flavoprotein
MPQAPRADPPIAEFPRDAEVLIVGAGASGAVAAKRLAEEGFRVVCLEQGGWVDHGDFRGGYPDGELVALKEFHPNPNVRANTWDYPVNDIDSEIRPFMYNAVGGSTILFGAQWMRLLPSDFRVRTLDGIADDWPITYEDLEPFYRQVDEDFGASGLAGNPAYPPSPEPPLPPLPIGRLGYRAAQALDRLGWHWWPGTNAIASRPYRGRRPCVQRGVCETGCAEGAKASTDLTHWPLAIAAGARLVTGARVKEITVDERGLATGAIFADLNGQDHRVRADVVLLAANGIGTPRLLLASQSARFPFGLANSSGLVGRRLMHHPYVTVRVVVDEDLGTNGAAGHALTSLQFYETDRERGFVRGAKWGFYPSGGPLAIAANHLSGSWQGDVRDHVRSRLGRSFVLSITAEDLPDESNRVELDSEQSDAAGIPAPKVTYHASENTTAVLRWNLAMARTFLAAVDAVDADVSERVANAGWHLLGTARMGDDPESSVVDRWNRAHDVPNLLIVDGSSFVTAGAVNPCATIAALSLRAVDHLNRTKRLITVPL